MQLSQLAKTNHRDRRLTKALARKGKNRRIWGEWEDRSYLRGHPEALPNLRFAYCNNIYSVQVCEVQTEWGLVLQVGIKRHDEKKSFPWQHLQRIKDELIGEERLAIEVFPPRSLLCDVANMRWLWVLPETMGLPFGLDRPLTSTSNDDA